MTPGQNDPLTDLLEYLKKSRGFDFTAYKRPSLERRIEKRMQAVGIQTIPEYHDYLQVHPDEFQSLFNTILINVTGFFRDQAIWDALSQEVLPELLKNKGPQDQIRIWSAACASGEEAYSLAVALCELIGVDDFLHRAKIYATDVDEDALMTARSGYYTPKQMEDMPPKLMEKYFESTNSGYNFRKDIRRMIIFGRHDLIKDAPISKVDVLTCRNAMIYFNAEAQARILTRFHFALNPGGLLLLGKAEMLLSSNQMFSAVDIKRRIFKKVSRVVPTEKVSKIFPETLLLEKTSGDDLADIMEFAVDTDPLAQIVMDIEGTVVHANEQCRRVFGISQHDVGRPIQDLQVSYQPLELRSLIQRACIERRPLVHRDLQLAMQTGQVRWFDVQFIPLMSGKGELLGCKIAFTEMTRLKQLHEELQKSRQALETAYEEMQAGNEELTTTNEELQTTVEELETTNEELQSSNEELETMNEELESTGQEMQTLNDELRHRGDELNQLNTFLETILGGINVGVAVLDGDMVVQRWNRQAEDLWGVRDEEAVGKHFPVLDIGLPLERIRDQIKAGLSGDHERFTTTVSAVNRRGREITCRVTGNPFYNSAKGNRGIIILMEEAPRSD